MTNNSQDEAEEAESEFQAEDTACEAVSSHHPSREVKVKHGWS